MSRAHLALLEVDENTATTRLQLEQRLAAVGLEPSVVTESTVSPEAPLLLIAGNAASVGVMLRRQPRMAPTFAMLHGAECDAVRLHLLVEGVADVFFSESGAPLDVLAAHVARHFEIAEVVKSATVTKRFGGSSTVWLRCLHECVTVARSECPATLLLGETGTGKDGAARLIHEARRSAGGEFVVVHCGAIVSTLSGSELFGHRRGAFSGADRDRDGAIARANGGTLFLDEVAELSPALQTELLRVLQDGSYRPVGEDRERVSRFRVVAATHEDLKQKVAQGVFREDLYFRLRGAEVRLPPLRERQGDVSELVKGFASEFLGEGVTVEPALERALLRYSFPGNVRELRSLVRVACARSPDARTLRLACLPTYALAALSEASSFSLSELDATADAAVTHGVTFNEFVDAAKESLVRAALSMARGSAREAAVRIGVSERCIQLRRRSTERASGAPPPPSEVTEGLEVAI